MLVFFLFVSVSFVAAILFYSIKRNLEYQDKIDELDDTLDSVIAALEEQHAKMDAKSKIEVFSDEPIIRELVQDIAMARDVVMKSASILKDVATSLQEEDEEIDEKIK